MKTRAQWRTAWRTWTLELSLDASCLMVGVNWWRGTWASTGRQGFGLYLHIGPLIAGIWR